MPTYPQMTLAQIRDQVRQRADMVVSQFVTDAELNGWINSSVAELYDLLVQKFGNDYFVELFSFSTANDVDRYDLPADFYKLLGVDLLLTPGDADQGAITLRPFTFAERNRYSAANAQTWLGITNLRYRLSGSKIWFTPTPSGAQAIRLWYVPRVAELVNDSDVADGVSGWLEYVVVDVATKALQKEESDVSVFLAQKAALIQRIDAAAENRDAGSPATVADVYLTSGAWPYNSGFGGGGWTL
jgi:hypothetical protein